MYIFDNMRYRFTLKEWQECYDLAKQRHDAKPKNIRNAGYLAQLRKGNEQYLPHFVGILGEMAYSKKSGVSLDRKIYKIRDDGKDFTIKGKKVEIRALTYQGDGEPELKIKQSEYLRKKCDLYVLVRVDVVKKTVEILGEITFEDFDKKKKAKKYGKYYPLNWVVPLSLMTPC
jgi:hypothetical protein